MGYLLDTSFLVDLAQSRPAAIQKAEQIEASGAVKVLATPVLFELMNGLLHNLGRTERTRLRRIVSSFLVLPFDAAAANAAAEIQANLLREGDPIGSVDAMIAGIAAAHGHVLVTRDQDLLDLDLGTRLDVEGY